MKTPKYITRVRGVIRNLISPKENTATENNFELTNTGFGISLTKSSRTKRTTGSLLTFMYSEENNNLFI